MGNCLNADAPEPERRLSAVDYNHPSLYTGLTWIQTSEILARKYEVVRELGRGGVGEVHLVKTRYSFCHSSSTTNDSFSLEMPCKGSKCSNDSTTFHNFTNREVATSSVPTGNMNFSIDARDSDGYCSGPAACNTSNGSVLLNGEFAPLSSTRKEAGRQYAMKTVYLDRVPKQKYRELEHEVLVLKKLDHPNIIRCREVFLYDEKICMILDLCQGDTLRNVNLDEEDTCTVITQILRALKYLHYTCGIAHRDLKLENIMLECKTKPLHVRLVDFGLSSAFCKGKKLTGCGGTPYSMAPELILEGEGFTEKTDMWSVGVITYVLLGHSFPFLRHSSDLGDTEYMDKFSLASYSMEDPIWENVSDYPKKLIKNLFVRSPQSRWDACESLNFCETEWKQGIQHSSTYSSDKEEFIDLSPDRTFSFHDICTSMRRFSNYSRLKKAALMVAAFTSPTEEIMILREAFLEINADKTGQIKLQVMECDDNLLNALWPGAVLLYYSLPSLLSSIPQRPDHFFDIFLIIMCVSLCVPFLC